MFVCHDLHGRVGVPRCGECNAPLSCDDACISSDVPDTFPGQWLLCAECLQLLISARAFARA